MTASNPDDFIDRLGEKIGLIAEELRQLGAYVAETSVQVRLTTAQLQETDGRLDQIVALVGSHEQRLQRLEGGAD